MPIIGLSLGKSNIRAVEVERRKDGLYLNNFGSYDNPRLNLDSEAKEDTDAFAASLADFISEIGFSTANVVVGLNEAHVFMRIIKLPLMNDKELKTSVKYEAEQYIPLPLDQVNLSYQRLDPDFQEKDKVNIQVVAARKDVLEKYVTLLRKAKLVPRAIEPEALALGRVLGDERNSPSGSMIVKIGFSSSLIIVSYGGFVRFTRSIPIGGDILTKAIQQGLNLDASQAEEYKKVYGMDKFQGEGKVYEVLKPIVDNLILEVKRASVFFTKHNPSANIKRVIITGGSALMPGLILYIANNLDIEVQVANPLRDVIFSPKAEKQKSTLIEQGPRFAASIGLAMREA